MRIPQSLSIVGVSMACAFLAAGCGGSQQAQAPPPSPHPAEQKSPPSMELETRTDTIDTVAKEAKRLSPAPAETTGTRYLVQIGAFKEPRNASKLQSLARERFQLTVLNTFDPGPGLYQVRLGYFDTYNDARAFCEQLKQDYPGEYQDCWVVRQKHR